MTATGYNINKVLVGIMVIISLLLSDKLSAQMTFHLAGPDVYKENLRQELNLVEKMKKISGTINSSSLKNRQSKRSNKSSLEYRDKSQGTKMESWQNESDKIVRSDTVQKFHLAQLKRNFAGNTRKTINLYQ